MTHANRHDPYGAVHKGIRAAHMRCLVAIGATDTASDAAVRRLLADLTDHLAMCNTHLEDENSVLHTALEARRPGASAHAAEDHDDHLQSFRELNGLIVQLTLAAREQRPALIAQLYRRFGRFVAADLLHMEHEEHVLLPELQSAFNDSELQELEGRIVAAISPEHMVLFMDTILSALPPADSAAMLEVMKAAMPPAAYSTLMRGVEQRREARSLMAAAA
jgi:ferredoxin-NADP reductase